MLTTYVIMCYVFDPFSVDWSNEIGFAPECLYEIGTPA